MVVVQKPKGSVGQINLRVCLLNLGKSKQVVASVALTSLGHPRATKVAPNGSHNIVGIWQVEDAIAHPKPFFISEVSVPIENLSLLLLTDATQNHCPNQLEGYSSAVVELEHFLKEVAAFARRCCDELEAQTRLPRPKFNDRVSDCLDIELFVQGCLRSVPHGPRFAGSRNRRLCFAGGLRNEERQLSKSTSSKRFPAVASTWLNELKTGALRMRRRNTQGPCRLCRDSPTPRHEPSLCTFAASFGVRSTGRPDLCSCGQSRVQPAQFASPFVWTWPPSTSLNRFSSDPPVACPFIVRDLWPR
jgi:hypothetical protein